MQKTAWHGTFAVAWEHRKRDAIPMCELRPRDLSCKGKFRTRLQRERNSIGRKCQRGTAANSCSHSTVAVQVALRRDFGTLRVIHSHLHITQMKKIGVGIGLTFQRNATSIARRHFLLRAKTRGHLSHGINYSQPVALLVYAKNATSTKPVTDTSVDARLHAHGQPPRAGPHRVVADEGAAVHEGWSPTRSIQGR
jgi:hypothetical protein